MAPQQQMFGPAQLPYPEQRPSEYLCQESPQRQACPIESITPEPSRLISYQPPVDVNDLDTKGHEELEFELQMEEFDGDLLAVAPESSVSDQAMLGEHSEMANALN